MSKSSFKNKVKQPWKKILAIAGISTITSGAIAGIVAGSIEYAKESPTSGNLGSKIQTTTSILLDDFKSNQQNYQTLKEISSQTQKQFQQIGFSEISANYSVSNEFNQITSKYENIGKITYQYTTPSARFNSINLVNLTKDREIVDAKLQLLSFFASTNQLSLQNASTLLHDYDLNRPVIKNDDFYFKNWWELNADSNNLELKNDQQKQERTLTVNLKTTDNLPLDLDFFDKEFATNYSYNPSTSESRQAAIQRAEQSNQPKKDPQNLWFLWTDRDGLIQKLNSLMLLSVAYNQKDVNSGYWPSVYNIYQSLNTQGEEKAFVDWFKNKKYEDYVITNVDVAKPTDPNSDRLLKVIKEFYQSSSHKATTTNSQTNQPTPITFENNQMFYSWNLDKLQLVNNNLKIIDYHSFFNYFDKLNKEDKSTYKSDKIVFSQTQSSSTINQSFENLKDNYIASSPSVDLFNNINNQNYAKSFYEFLDRSNKIDSNLDSSVLSNIDLKSSIIIGLAVVILIIAIIVSLLYKIPGLMFSLLIGFGFVIQLLFIKTANIGFGIETYGALFVSIFLPLVNLTNFSKDIQTFIQNGYSYKNALVNALKKAIINFGGFYLLLIFITLILMYFTKGLTSSFGFNLMLADFAFLITTYIGYLLFVWSWKIVSSYHPKYHLYGNSLKTANAINNNQFEFNFTNHKENKIQELLFKTFSVKWLWILFVVVAFAIIIVGITLMLTISPYANFEFNSVWYVVFDLPITNVDNNLFNSYLSSFVKDTNLIWVLDNQNPQINNDIQQIINLSQSKVNVLFNNPYLVFDDTKNTIAAYAIILAIAFVWSVIWVHWTAMFIVIVNITIGTLMIFGANGLFRIPLNQYSILAANTSFIILVIITFNLAISFKDNHWIKTFYSKKQLKTNTFQSLVIYIKNYNKIYLLVILSLLVLLIFVPYQILVWNAVVILATIFTYYLAIILGGIIWYLTIILQQKLRINTLSKNDYEKNDYDKIDEQEIININRF